MADVTVRKEGNSPSSLARPGPHPLRRLRELLRWDPARDFSSFAQWDPFQEMAPLLNEMGNAEFSPAFEVKETKDSFLFKADVPGVKESDIEVNIVGNRLTVSGSRSEEHEEKADTYYSCECRYGNFSRSFTLPESADTDSIRADLKSGVLTVAVPKRPQAQPKKIAVKSGGVKA